MMKLNIFCLLLIFCIQHNPVTASQAINKSGRAFLNAGTNTNFYRFKTDELRKEVSEETRGFLNNSSYTTYEEDTFNYNIGVGYYINDKASLLFNYNPDLSFGDFEGIFRGILPLSGEDSDVDLDIYDLEFHYRFLDFSEKLYLYSNLGISYHRVKIKNYRSFAWDSVLVSSESINDTSLKAGIGIQWDFSHSFGIKLGFTKSDFLSTDKSYIHMEFRF